MHYHHISLILFVIVEKNSFIITVIILFPLFALSESEIESAAEQDWVTSNQHSDSEPVNLCGGRYAPSSSSIIRPQRTGDSISVTADEVLHAENKVTIFDGEAEAQSMDRTINASRITFDRATNNAVAIGAVSIREDGLLVKSDYAESDLSKGSGMMKNATFVLHENQIRGRATQLIITQGKILKIEEGSFTRCSPRDEFWHFHGKDIELRRGDGYGVAEHATIRIKGIPIAYAPYLRFSLNNERASGFLTPSIGYNKRNGLDVSIPYYLNLSPKYDATYTFRDVSKRGIVHGFETRHLSEFSSSEINTAYLSDDNQDQNILVYSDLKRERWSLYLNHDGDWPSGWTTSLSYNAVSDIDYLDDIGGIRGSAPNHIRQTPISTTNGTPSLMRTAELGYTSNRWSTNILARRHQNLTRNGTEQYAILPQLNFQFVEKIFPFDLVFKGQFSRFSKTSNELIMDLPIGADRYVIDSNIRLPLEKSWGFINSEVGALFRKYKLHSSLEKEVTKYDFKTPYASIDTALSLERPFSYKKRNYLQTLVPRIYFLYLKKDHEPRLPQFDSGPYTPSFSNIFRRDQFSGYDELRGTRRISIGITTAFFRRNSGKEFFKASIGQIKYLDNQDSFLPSGIRKTFPSKSSPIFVQSRLQFNRINVNASYEWDSKKSQTNQISLSARYKGENPSKIFNLSYSYTKDRNNWLGRFQNSKETNVSFFWPIKNKWGVLGRWNFNWDNNQTIESLVGLEYNACCWRTRIVARRYKAQAGFTLGLADESIGETITSRRRTETGVFLEFQLKGLSTLGERLDDLLENSISGYQPWAN